MKTNETPADQAVKKTGKAVKWLSRIGICLLIAALAVLVIQLGSGKPLKVTLIDILSKTTDGISLGSIYAIIALGYTMVYGIAKMLNFAHGDVIMIGAYVSYTSMMYAGVPSLLALAIAMAVCTILGVVIERLAYRPLRSAPSLAVLITAIGVSYLLQNIALLIWSANPKSYPTIVTFGSLSFFGGSLTVSGESIVCIAACILVMIGLTVFTSKTRTGKGMRAVAEDRDAAELMGISVNKTIAITFAIGSALAAIAGVLYCSMYPRLEPTTGAIPGIKAFTAAVLGGIGSIPGTLVGGLLLGVIEIFSKAYINDQLADAIVFAVLVVILLVRPAGLLGKKVTEKV